MMISFYDFFFIENYTDEGDAFTYGDNDTTGSEDKQSEKDNTEVLYGVLIGVPVTACIVTIIVWAVHRNSKLIVL